MQLHVQEDKREYGTEMSRKIIARDFSTCGPVPEIFSDDLVVQCMKTGGSAALGHNAGATWDTLMILKEL